MLKKIQISAAAKATGNKEKLTKRLQMAQLQAIQTPQQGQGRGQGRGRFTGAVEAQIIVIETVHKEITREAEVDNLPDRWWWPTARGTSTTMSGGGGRGGQHFRLTHPQHLTLTHSGYRQTHSNDKHFTITSELLEHTNTDVWLTCSWNIQTYIEQPGWAKQGKQIFEKKWFKKG